MLCDAEILDLLDQRLLRISPRPLDRAFQPASVDLRLGGAFLPAPDYKLITAHQDVYTIVPGECVLATTMEEVDLPDNVAARVEGKSTWGRKFLMVHSTAGFIDPGFCGAITLELKNLSPVPIALKVGDYIAQISFEPLGRNALRPYGHPGLSSKYQGQYTVTAPRDQPPSKVHNHPIGASAGCDTCLIWQT